jgi:hypothetical protein
MRDRQRAGQFPIVGNREPITEIHLEAMVLRIIANRVGH